MHQTVRHINTYLEIDTHKMCILMLIQTEVYREKFELSLVLKSMAKDYADLVEVSAHRLLSS